MWQQRYFCTNNGYLNYFSDSTKTRLLASIDLSRVEFVDGVDPENGWFQLTYDVRGCARKMAVCNKRILLPFPLSALAGSHDTGAAVCYAVGCVGQRPRR